MNPMKKIYGVTLDVKTQYHARVVLNIDEIIAYCPELEEHVKTQDAFLRAVYICILDIGADGTLYHGQKPVGGHRTNSIVTGASVSIDRDYGADEDFNIWGVEELDDEGDKHEQ